MRIVNLIENTQGAEGCLWEHGLSFYIETGNHKILADTARKWNVPLQKSVLLPICPGNGGNADGRIPL